MLHPLDITLLLAALILLLATALYTSLRRRSRKPADFFTANRTLGSLLQFFLTFGYMADSNEAANVATETYREGVAGMWIGFQALFVTPFFYFTSVWFRRSRQITFADLFTDRFNSRPLAATYAAIHILLLTTLLALGNITAFKLASAMLVKPPEKCTPAELQRVAQFNELQSLKSKIDANTALSSIEAERFRQLESLLARNQISSYISWLKPAPFYLTYSLIVASYVLLGGIHAVAVVDAIQSAFLLLVSLLLIPMGLAHLGGWHGLHTLHTSLPDYMFRVFGDADLSEYSPLTIFALVLNCLVGTPSTGGPGNASGKNEHAVRVGTLTGAFSKRLLMIAWMFSGLLAAALLPRHLFDPDTTWGQLSTHLLHTVPGFLGLMIAGMLLGHMPNVAYTTITISALFTRNIYDPIRQHINNSPRATPAASGGAGNSPAATDILTSGSPSARIPKLAALAALILAALIPLLYTGGMIPLLMNTMTFIAFGGAAGYLLYFWRKLTAAALWISMVLWLLLIGILPWALPQFSSFRQNPTLLVTIPHPQNVANSQQIPAQLPPFTLPHASRTLPARTQYALYFDRIARIDPTNPVSPVEGLGRFNIENYLVHLVGIPLQTCASSTVVSFRWLVDSILPFLLLIGFSYLPIRNRVRHDAQQKRNSQFFAKLRTPIGLTPDIDAQEVAISLATPTRFDHLKLAPKSNWELYIWNRKDLLAFAACWIAVALILALLYAIAHAP